jgi:hypothetical protein
LPTLCFIRPFNDLLNAYLRPLSQGSAIISIPQKSTRHFMKKRLKKMGNLRLEVKAMRDALH